MTVLDNYKGLSPLHRYVIRRCIVTSFAVYAAAIGASIKNKISFKNLPFV